MSSKEIERVSVNLPGFRPSIIQLLQLTFNEKTSFADVVRVLKTDPVLSAQVLSVSNSGLLGRSLETSSVLQALTMLGIQRLSGLLLAASLQSNLARNPDPLVVQWWRHSIATAILSEKLGAHTYTENCHTAGLLHAIGQLMLILPNPGRFREFAESCGQHDMDPVAAEGDCLGISGREAAQMLARKWSLPASIARTLAHYNAEGSPDGTLGNAVSMGCAAAEILGFGAYPVPRGLDPCALPQGCQELLDDPQLLENTSQRINAIECMLGR